MNYAVDHTKQELTPDKIIATADCASHCDRMISGYHTLWNIVLLIVYCRRISALGRNKFTVYVDTHITAVVCRSKINPTVHGYVVVRDNGCGIVCPT